ncbi:acyl-CoA dehydrogenase [Pyrenochaeta sp. MPI-SDFR-AT-0127]|nr:acyl-CoA dehydrogenase [Pyrenochaeta sp. MPI-SDFR-AT-0127]
MSDSISPWVFGSTVPYAEPPWSRGVPSPHIKESHRRLRQAMRQWVEKHIIPHVYDWEEAGGASLPNSVYEEAAKAGLLPAMASGAKVPREWWDKYTLIGDVPPMEWDGFHDMIVHDEFLRAGGIGVINGLCGGVVLGTPAIQKFGSADLKERVVGEILAGKKRLALAITEPNAGSDVQGLTTKAQLAKDGKHFIVDGQKKWITGGLYADYFLTLVVDADYGGQTLLVIPRTEGLETRHMKMSGSGSAGTAFVDLDEVKVPIENVVGERGKAFKYIMSNFNHERLMIAFHSLRSARVCLEDSMTYALTRETFGKRLVDHPVVRYKFAHMSRETEALQAWVESLVSQADMLSSEDATLHLAGATAQLKAHSGIVLEHVVREAIQIMGGTGLTRGGRGERVERIWRDVKAITVPGGSEEILLDFATRRALKIHELLTPPKGSRL